MKCVWVLFFVWASTAGVVAQDNVLFSTSLYLLRSTLVYKPKDLNRDWSPRFSTLRDKNGWIRAKLAGNLNIGVSRNRFCDFLADPGSRSFSRFYTNIDRSRYNNIVYGMGQVR